MLVTIGDTDLFTSRALDDPYITQGATPLANLLVISLSSISAVGLASYGGTEGLITLEGVDLVTWANVECLYRISTMAIHDKLEERSTASLMAWDELGSTRETPWHFKEGMAVLMRDFSSHYYSGVVSDSIENKLPGGNTVAIEHDLTFTDDAYRIDKIVVKGTWLNASVGSQVRDLLNTYFTVEGIREGEIQEGLVTTQAVTNYIHGNAALDDRKNYMGTFTWFVDDYKKLYFIDRTTYACPWTMTPADGRQATVEMSSPKYRNRQYILGAQDQTVLQTEYALADGVNQNFNLRFNVGLPPAVWVSTDGKVTWTPKSLGVRGVDTGYDFYYAIGSNSITQDASASPLAAGSYLKTQYIGLTPIMTLVSSAPAIALQKLMEGIGTGNVDDVESDTTITDKQAALDKASAYLSHYAVQGRIFKCSTRRNDGIAAGQMITIDYPKYGINNDTFLIDAIDITEKDNIIWFAIEAVDGPITPSAEAIFAAMVSTPTTSVIQENVSTGSEVIGLYQFSKNWHIADNPNLFNQVIPSASTYATTTFWPCVDQLNDTQTYCALLDVNSNEICRVYKTEQTVSTTQIVTTFFVTAQEGNAAIAKIAIYGGYWASNTPGSGILFDLFNFVYTKNSLEALQLEITDSLVD